LVYELISVFAAFFIVFIGIILLIFVGLIIHPFMRDKKIRDEEDRIRTEAWRRHKESEYK